MKTIQNAVCLWMLIASAIYSVGAPVVAVDMDWNNFRSGFLVANARCSIATILVASSGPETLDTVIISVVKTSLEPLTKEEMSSIDRFIIVEDGEIIGYLWNSELENWQGNPVKVRVPIYKNVTVDKKARSFKIYAELTSDIFQSAGVTVRFKITGLDFRNASMSGIKIVGLPIDGNSDKFDPTRNVGSATFIPTVPEIPAITSRGDQVIGEWIVRPDSEVPLRVYSLTTFLNVSWANPEDMKDFYLTGTPWGTKRIKPIEIKVENKGFESDTDTRYSVQDNGNSVAVKFSFDFGDVQFDAGKNHKIKLHGSLGQTFRNGSVVRSTIKARNEFLLLGSGQSLVGRYEADEQYQSYVVQTSDVEPPVVLGPVFKTDNLDWPYAFTVTAEPWQCTRIEYSTDLCEWNRYVDVSGETQSGKKLLYEYGIYGTPSGKDTYPFKVDGGERLFFRAVPILPPLSSVLARFSTGTNP